LLNYRKNYYYKSLSLIPMLIYISCLSSEVVKAPLGYRCAVRESRDSRN